MSSTSPVVTSTDKRMGASIVHACLLRPGMMPPQYAEKINAARSGMARTAAPSGRDAGADIYVGVLLCVAADLIAVRGSIASVLVGTTNSHGVLPRGLSKPTNRRLSWLHLKEGNVP